MLGITQAVGEPDTTCDVCDFVCTDANVAAAQARHAGLSLSKHASEEKQHKKSHYSKLIFKRKLVRNDHRRRHFSALHFRLNGTSNTAMVTLCKGATNARRAKLNRVCEGHDLLMYFEEKGKHSKDKRPNGNTCRQMLGKKGQIVLDLLRTAHDRPLDGSMPPIAAPTAAPPVAAKVKPKDNAKKPPRGRIAICDATAGGLEDS